MVDSMLTTIDNPHDPFTEYEAWYGFDVASGYRTTELLARVTISSPNLSDADQELAIEQAIDEIVEQNSLGVFKKVTRELPEVNV